MLLVTLACLLLMMPTHSVALDPTAAHAPHRDLTSADIAQIVSAAVDAATSPSPAAKPQPPERPLLLDLSSSNDAFESFVGRDLPVDTAQWLRDTPHTVVLTGDVLKCRAVIDAYSRCRIASNGQLARVTRVAVDSATKNIIVYVHVVFNSPEPSPEILSFTALMHVYSRGGRWLVDDAKSVWAVA